MPKSTKRFVISTNELNSQGFRVLTSGVKLDAFAKNPLLLWNHVRPKGSRKSQILPLGHWEDIQIEGDKITGVPVFDDKDDFAMSIYNKVEGNHLRMCSAGLEPVKTSTKKADLLPGQKLATVTECILKEASICDIGANPDALAVALYDSNDKLITLSETIISKIDTMSTNKTTAAAAFAALKLAKDAKEKYAKLSAQAAEKVQLALADDGNSDEDKEKLAEEDEPATDEDKDKKIAALEEKLKALQDENEKMSEQLKMAEDSKEEEKAKALAEKAVALRKITLAQKETFLELAKTNYKKAEEFLNGLKVTPTIQSQLSGKTGAVSLEDKKSERILALSAKPFKELFNSGELAELKTLSLDAYKAKFKEGTGKEPKNV